MHELGVVFHVIDSVNEIAVANNVRRVSKVTLEIGEVSTVIPSYLSDCWNWAVKRETILKDAELGIEIIKAINYCEDCHCEYSAMEYGRICPECKSEHTYILQGNEFMIKEIEVPEEEE